MVVTPDSSIRLLKCPLRLDDQNQLTFANITAQTNYFLSLPYIYDENLSYIRKDGVIRVATSSNIEFEDLLKYNYCMYKNNHYEDKWFYAYITNIEYKNDGCTEITIETDVFQTWQFDIVWKHSFIEREHVNDDTLGKHTVPENLETGEYICNAFDYTSQLDTVRYVLLATTWPDGSQPIPRATLIGDIPYAGYVYVFNDVSELSAQVNSYNDRPENIYAVYAVPDWVVANKGSSPSGAPIYMVDNIPANNQQITTSKQTTLNGYNPINNKVRCFPYNYLLVSNNNGQSNILKYERFNGASCTFGMTGIASVGADIKLTPTNYDSINHDEENAIIAGKWPTLSWSSDMYTNWLSQNAVNIGIGQTTSVLSIVGGIGLLATGGGTTAGIGLIAGGIGGIASSMAQQYQHSFDPNSFKGNVNSGSINVCNERNGFYFYKMSIKAEYAQMIDEYFGAYGYKVNRLGTPHIHVRSNWDFLKTIKCNLQGDIPENDLEKLRNIMNTGCTFWHTTSNFLDYSQTNSII